MTHVERAAGTCRSISSGAGTSASANHGCGTTSQGFLNLLWANEVNMCIDGAGRDDELLPSNNFGGGPNDERRADVIHDIGIASLAQTNDLAVSDTDIRLRESLVITQENKKGLTLKIPDQSMMRAFVITRSKVSDEERLVA